MHRLRNRVFKERLDWDVRTDGRYEVYSFDALKPHYLILRGSDWPVVGCVRLLPSNGPTMLRDTFPVLLEGETAPEEPSVWKTAVSLLIFRRLPRRALAELPSALTSFSRMIEFGLPAVLAELSPSPLCAWGGILRRAGWPLSRNGEAHTIGNRAVARHLDVSWEGPSAVRRNGGFRGPVGAGDLQRRVVSVFSSC
ncbi:MAG: conjugal transfer protein TraI [Mesorhizobium sp.]|nr:MAG: conjugal transfer protein TraI [Mesorhizobium sp.]